MTGERRGIPHDHAVADQTVVGHVRLGHDQTIVTNLRQHPAAGSAAMDRDKLANLVARAETGFRRFVFVFQILLGKANRNKRKDVCAFTNPRVAVDNAMRLKTDIVCEHYVVTNNAVRSDKTFGAYSGLWADYSSGMNRSRMSSSRHIRNSYRRVAPQYS